MMRVAVLLLPALALTACDLPGGSQDDPDALKTPAAGVTSVPDAELTNLGNDDATTDEAARRKIEMIRQRIEDGEHVASIEFPARHRLRLGGQARQAMPALIQRRWLA